MDKEIFSLNPGSAGFERCNGCAVCTLSCPLWNHTRDLLLTSCGRMRSFQSEKQGELSEPLRASAGACILCGSCGPLCFFGIDTVSKTIEMRAAINKGAPLLGKKGSISPAKGKVFLANDMLLRRKETLDKLTAFLGASLHGDGGEDISMAFETGRPVTNGRVEEFVGSLKSASEIITADGLIFRLLKQKGLNVLGIGEALLKIRFKSAVGPSDLYVIDPMTYHSDFKRLVGFYTGIAKETGCQMNLDLHRLATPTGASRFGRRHSLIDPAKQTEWILRGRPPKRIIAERIEDVEILRKSSGLPVFFIAELV